MTSLISYDLMCPFTWDSFYLSDPFFFMLLFDYRYVSGDDVVATYSPVTIKSSFSLFAKNMRLVSV